MRVWGCIIVFLLVGCSPNLPRQKNGGVVSLDMCADQAVLSLLPKSRIIAVSPEVKVDPAYALVRAKGIARVRPSIENILALRPSIVVRSYGGGIGIENRLKAAGVRVVQLGYASTLTDVVPQLNETAAALGVPEKGKAIADDFEARIAAIPHYDSAPRLLYITPGNVTTGPDSFVGQMISAVGFRTYSDRNGWPNLPLEEMQVEPPLFVARAFFDSSMHRQDAWSLSRHKALSRATKNSVSIDLPGGWVACGNHLSIFAIEAMAKARKTYAVGI
jgi:iron complex transport system substrate-binding protein